MRGSMTPATVLQTHALSFLFFAILSYLPVNCIISNQSISLFFFFFFVAQLSHSHFYLSRGSQTIPIFNKIQTQTFMDILPAVMHYEKYKQGYLKWHVVFCLSVSASRLILIMNQKRGQNIWSESDLTLSSHHWETEWLGVTWYMVDEWMWRSKHTWNMTESHLPLDHTPCTFPCNCKG